MELLNLQYSVFQTKLSKFNTNKIEAEFVEIGNSWLNIVADESFPSVQYVLQQFSYSK